MKQKGRKTHFSPRDVANVSWAVVLVVCVSLLLLHRRLLVFHVVVLVGSLSKYLKKHVSNKKSSKRKEKNVL
jgi:hypothetical protein